MNYSLIASLLVLLLFISMLVLLEVGRRIGIRRLAIDAEGARAGLGAVDGAVFALLGLMIAFTFSGASSRLEVRRQLIVQEANAIGTAYLRLDLLPPGAQPALRENFRQYVDARLAMYSKLHDFEAAKAERMRATALQNEIWTRAVSASREGATPQAIMLLLPALNEMIDITTTRTVALVTHPPPIVFAMVALLAFACSLLAGYGMAGGRLRSWTHMLGFAGILTLTFYLILDLEFPRFGAIRIDGLDQLLVDVRASMK